MDESTGWATGDVMCLGLTGGSKRSDLKWRFSSGGIGSLQNPTEYQTTFIRQMLAYQNTEPTVPCGKQASSLAVMSSPDSRRASVHAPGGEGSLVDCQGERIQRLSVGWLKSTRFQVGAGAGTQNERLNGGMLCFFPAPRRQTCKAMLVRSIIRHTHTLSPGWGR